MKKYFKIRNKGITLITLVVAVSIMIIISSLLIYNARTGIKVRNYKMMQNDIELLDDKVSAYYMKYGALPVEIKYNVNPLPFESVKNPNDNENYYVLDLKVFEGLTLNYGADYDKVTESNVADFTDLYIINEQSHKIYYAKGIEMDGAMYYTNNTDDDVSINRKWIWEKGIQYSYFNYFLGLDNRGDIYKIDNTYSGYPDIEKLYPLPYKIVEISSGMMNSVALDEYGKVYTWGNNSIGQLGNGTNENSSLPICISNQENNILKDKKIIKISVGYGFTVAIDENGKVYTWGNNILGQLGNGTTEDSNIPICISDQIDNILYGKKIVQISANGLHTVAVDENGKIYTWGRNDFSKLEIENIKDLSYNSLPICISDQENNVLNGKKITKVSASMAHTIAIDNQGKVYAWGNNTIGQLGNGEYGEGIYSNIPICISDQENNILKNKKIIKISAGGYNTLVIDEQGKVYTWGLTDFESTSSGSIEDMPFNSFPICMSEQEGNIFNEKNIIDVSAGTLAASAIDNEGKVYTWGFNMFGILGNGSTENSNIPICISEIEGNILKDKKATQISMASTGMHSLVIDENGEIYSWGYNYDGQLGNGTTEDSNIPIYIISPYLILKDKNIIDFSSNFYQLIALSKNGKIYVAMPDEDQYNFVCISDQVDNILYGKKIVQISASAMYTVAIDNQGKAYLWPFYDNNSIICINDQPDNILYGKKIVSVSIGRYSTIAIDEDGKVYTWNNEESEELYSNLICISDQVDNVLYGKKIVEVSSAPINILSDFDHMVAIDEDGKVYAWGTNEKGQLGNGQSGEGAYSNIPICISELEDNILKDKKIIKISAGSYHTVAIDEDGKVYAWGWNAVGQLGNGQSGTGEYSDIPICISDLENSIIKGKKIVKIIGGDASTILIDEKGRIYIFGTPVNPS